MASEGQFAQKPAEALTNVKGQVIEHAAAYAATALNVISPVPPVLLRRGRTVISMSWSIAVSIRISRFSEKPWKCPRRNIGQVGLLDADDLGSGGLRQLSCLDQPVELNDQPGLEQMFLGVR